MLLLHVWVDESVNSYMRSVDVLALLSMFSLSSSFGHADKSLRSKKQKGGLSTKGIWVKLGCDLAGLFNIWNYNML